MECYDAQFCTEKQTYAVVVHVVVSEDWNRGEELPSVARRFEALRSEEL
jgi:hypothetical protein